MSRERVSFSEGKRWVVGSLGSAAALENARPEAVPEACEILEIRLDALATGKIAANRAVWSHLVGVPLLFTARRREEGGNGDLDANTRTELLREALPDAALIDVELASTAEMKGILQEIQNAGIPWVASFHDFERLPTDDVLAAAAKRARDAGAAVFKLAARIHGPDDLARLARFQASDQGLPLAVMGMGPLAPVSRLLCAQYGSVLNYGYLGETPTAPGQWDCAALKRAIGVLEQIG